MLENTFSGNWNKRRLENAENALKMKIVFDLIYVERDR